MAKAAGNSDSLDLQPPRPPPTLPSATLRCQTAWSLVCVQSVRGTPEPAWCLRYAPNTNLAFASSGRSSHNAVLGVELEQPLKGRSCIQISQRIGDAANPGPQPDGYRAVARHRRLGPSALGVGRRGQYPLSRS